LAQRRKEHGLAGFEFLVHGSLNPQKIIYFQKVNLKKLAKIKDPKVFPKIKNGQKKCPIFKNRNTL